MKKLLKEWKEEAKNDLEVAIKNMKAYYKEKISRLEKQLAQIVVEKDSYTSLHEKKPREGKS